MKRSLLSLPLALAVAAPIVAQEPAVPLAVGTVAPDFEIPGGTQSGVLDKAIKLSDFRGKTVVIAFFYRARSGG
jgi:hypothetical protein